MKRKLHHIILLAACLMATGTHWDLLQLFAWTRMFATNVESASVTVALTRTFDPKEMCPLCLAVQRAKNEGSDRNTPPDKFEGKAPLFFAALPVFELPMPMSTRWRLTGPAVAEATRDAPPTPPPRGRCV